MLGIPRSTYREPVFKAGRDYHDEIDTTVVRGIDENGKPTETMVQDTKRIFHPSPAVLLKHASAVGKPGWNGGRTLRLRGGNGKRKHKRLRGTTRVAK